MKWEMVKIGDIGELIQTGKTPPTKEEKYFNGEINWYNPSDFTEKKLLNSSNRTITQIAINDKKAIIFPKGTVLITCIGNIGKVGICKVDSSSNQQITGIKPKKYIDSNYLYYWLKANQKTLEHFANKAVVPILNGKNLKNIKFQYPNSLPEQKRIAQLLDTADALRQKDKALLAAYDELLESVFLEMFGDKLELKGWNIKKLNDVCQKITDGTHYPPKFIDSGIPFLLISNIVDNEINFDTKKFISEEDYKVLLRRTPIEKGDLLYTTVGSYGNPAIVKGDKKFMFQRHIGYLKPKHDLVNYYFLFGMLKSHIVKRQVDRVVKGIAQKTLNLRELKNIKIMLPPISLQNKFAEIVQNIEAQKERVRLQLKESEDLFGALMQGVFG